MDTEKATVRDYMTKDVFTVKYDTPNNDVIKLKQKLYGQGKVGNIRDKIQTRYDMSHQILNLSFSNDLQFLTFQM